MLKSAVISISLLCLFSQHAYSGNLPEATAFDASIEAVAQVFSSPALPTLDNERASITPLYGIVTIEGVEESATLANGDSLKISNNGELKGDVAGLAFNYSWGDVGVFITFAGSRVTGDLVTTTSGTTINNSVDIRDISAQSLVGVAGLNYRFIGDAKSTFAMGIFGGPSIIQSQTSARFQHSDGTSTKVSLDPNLSGIYLGLQMMLRLGQFRINPYMNVMTTTDSECLKPTYAGDPYPAGEYNRCENGEHGINSYSGVYGTGINAGYGRFIFGLASLGAGSNGAFKSKPLLFSFRASF